MKEAWWKCPDCGTTWSAQIRTRTKGMMNCPTCSKENIKKKHASDCMPESLFSEYDEAKNGCTPQQFKIHNFNLDKIWWICPICFNSFQASIKQRMTGTICPFCHIDGRRQMKGVNDFATLRPGLLKDWDYESNKGIDPTSVSIKSPTMVTWKCSKCGYKWQASIRARVNGKKSCKKCR